MLRPPPWGSIDAILVDVALALLRFVRLVSRPKVEVLGTLAGMPGFHATERHPDAQTVPGLVLFRFKAPIAFFNAPVFKREALAAAEAAGPALKWFVLDMLPVTSVDATGLYAAREIIDTLTARGVVVVQAGRETEWQRWKQRRGLETERLPLRVFPTLRQAVRAFRQENPALAAPQEQSPSTDSAPHGRSGGVDG